MKIKSAVFYKSYPDCKLMQKDDMPEFAFVGRSNVGKSSLINMLSGKKGLAKTSGVPGKTRLINQFIINNDWNLIDLPGYGFTKLSHSLQNKIGNMIENYITKREQLLCVFQLIDSRLTPQKLDMEFSLFLGHAGVPFSFIFTKCDKLAQHKTKKNLSLFKKTLHEFWKETPPIFMSSAKTGAGRADILHYLNDIKTNNCEQKSIV